MRKEVKPAEFYQRNILNSITNYLAMQQYNDLIVIGNFNEDIFSDTISSFFCMHGLNNTHTTINN